MQVHEICKLRTTRSPLAAYKWISIDDLRALLTSRVMNGESIFYSYNAFSRDTPDSDFRRLEFED